MFDKRILNIFSILTGLLFFISGLGKVVDTENFSYLILEYGLGYLMVLSPLIVLIEIALGLHLILLVKAKQNAFYSFILLLLFTILYAYAYLVKGVTDCGCFGRITHAALPPALTFARNFLLMGMTLIIWLKYPKEKLTTPAWKRICFISLMCLAIFTAGLSFRIPAFLRPSKQSHAFLNTPLSSTPLSSFLKPAADSTYLIFCFSYTCPHCWNSIENLRSYQSTQTVDSVILIGTGKPDDKAFFEDYYKHQLSIRHIEGEIMQSITPALPTAFYIVNDSVKAVFKSVLPSPYIFLKKINPESQK